MSITILVDRGGIRARASVSDHVNTRIPGVNKIHWYGPQVKSDREYYSLVHLETGRALNKVPLTTDEADRLVDALLDCPIDWDRIVDNGKTWPGVPYFTGQLTDEAKKLAGVY